MKALRQNLPEKILALVLALFMWASARDLENPQQVRLKLTLQRRNLPKNLIIVRGPRQVQFVLRGSRKQLRKVSPRTLAPYVDLSHARPGRGSFEIYYRLSGSVGLRQIDVLPSRAEFEFDELVTRRFTPELVTTGTLPPGFEIGAHQTRPAQVTVTGRKSLVDQVAAARVTVDISDPQASLRVVPVDLLTRSGEVVKSLKPHPATVELTLEFREQQGEATVPVRVQTTGQVARGITLQTIQVRPRTVVLTGRVDRLREVLEVQTQPIDLTGVTETTEVRVPVVVPPGMHLAGSGMVTATIIVQPTSGAAGRTGAGVQPPASETRPARGTWEGERGGQQ